MRPQQKLQVDLAASAPVHASAFGPLVLRSAATLFAPPIQNHLDVPVAPETIQQILVETSFAVGDKKEMSGHGFSSKASAVPFPEALETLVGFREAVRADGPECKFFRQEGRMLRVIAEQED